MQARKYNELDVYIFENRTLMGEKAAVDAAECIKKVVAEKGEANCIFAAAPSQNDFLKALVADKTIPWEKVNAYHMDDYVGLEQGCEQSFSGFLKSHIFDLVPLKSVNLINGQNDQESESERYSKLLKEHKTDIVFMGIGENGHIAFNDPGVADFNDPKYVKVVKLDDKCRMQQVHDKCFPTFDDVPEKAFTVTITGLMAADYHFCIVPTKLKAPATKRMLEGPVSEECPATILRNRKNAKMYIDEDCAYLLNT